MDALIGELEVVLFLVAAAVSMLMIVRRVTIARHDAVAPVQELTLATAEALLRSTQLRAIVAAFGVALVIAGGWQVHVHVVALFSVAFAFALQSYLNAWRVRYLIGQPHASAELRGTTLTGCSDGTQASVIVSVRAAAAVREHAVPRAIVR